ncbi:MAG: hypothetical protein WBZ45_06075 [Acidimicrobiia bacterium]
MDDRSEHLVGEMLPAWWYRRYPVGPSITRRQLMPDELEEYLAFLESETERVKDELTRLSPAGR